MAATVTGKLLNPSGVGLVNAPFIIRKAEQTSRLAIGDRLNFTTNGTGNFTISLSPGFYVLLYGNDKLYFRVKQDGVSYNIGDILERLK